MRKRMHEMSDWGSVELDAEGQALQAEIEECQSRGKMITLSLGGATGSVGFVSRNQAIAFADDIWNLFLGGGGDFRPLGRAALDG